MANSIKKVSNVNGGAHHLGNIEIAAIRGVEQGLNSFSGTYQEGIRRNVQLLTDGGETTSYTALTLSLIHI